MAESTSDHFSQLKGSAVIRTIVSFIAALLFAEWLIFGPANIMSGEDYALMNHFYKAYFKNAILSGVFPLWNPYVLLGRPFAADCETAVFSPFTWLFVIFPEETAYSLFLALHLTIGGCGMFRLTREWSMSKKAAVFAGIAFVVSQPIVAHIQGGLIGYIGTISFWPWMLLFVDRLCDKPTSRDWLKLSGILTLAFLAGHLHTFWLCGCSLGFFILPRCIARNWKSAGKRMIVSYGLLALACVFALAIAAIQLLPLIELAYHSNRMSGNGISTFGSITWQGFRSLFFPVPGRLVGSVWDGEMYIGLPVVIMAMFTFVRIRDPRVRALICMACASLVVALGNNTILFRAIRPFVPFLGLFRYNAKFVAFVVFTMIICASLAWGNLEREPETPRESGGKALILLCFSTLLIRWIDVNWIFPTVAALATGIILAAYWRKSWTRHAFFICMALWTADYVPSAVALGKEFHNIAYVWDVMDCLPKNVAGKILPSRDIAPPRIFIPLKVLMADSGMINGFSIVQCYTSMPLERPWNYLHLAAGIKPCPYELSFLYPSVHDGNPLPYPGAAISVSYDVKNNTYLLLSNPEMIGSRSWITGNVTFADDWHDALDDLLSGFNPRCGAVVEKPDTRETAGIVENATGRARVTAFTRNTVTVEVESDARAVLVLSEAWFPGWRAKVNGVETKVFPVNEWMRGVVIPKGESRVEFSFHSTFLPLGATISLVSLAAYLFLWFRRPAKTTAASFRASHERTDIHAH